MGTKVKGLLKGLRYISQIFDSEKEEEIQIGNPTDVKHVAHIGWDGPSTVHPPSWMDEFKSPGLSSAPRSQGGNDKQDPPAKSVPQDSSEPKSRGQQSSDDDPSGKRRQSRRNKSASASNSPTRDSSNQDKPPQQFQDPGSESNPIRSKLPDLPKKSRRKKSKDSSGSGSSRSRRRNQVPVNYTSPFSDPGTGSGSGSRFNDKELYPKSPLRRHELVKENNCN